MIPFLPRLPNARALQAPELLVSIENALQDLGEAQRESLEIQREGNELAKFYAENNKAHVAGVQDLAKAAKALMPTRVRMPTTFKKSASVKGCN